MHEKITPQILQRLAIVYIRQSSPGQVRNNLESYRVQSGLVGRARELGFAESRIRVIEGDQGESATLPGTRDAFAEMLELVKSGQVGMIFAFEVARLARNNLDWNVLIHYCAFIGVVLGDESEVFDPAIPQDSLSLGIQAVLAVHELHGIRKRLDRGLREKASRGELHPGVPPGYICVEGKHLVKHSDRRVQRVIELVFGEYGRCVSVYQLMRRLWKKEVQLPVVRAGADPSQVEWVEPDYDRLLNMLENPKYAGIYAYPRTKVVVEMTPEGTFKKRTRKVPRGEWEVEILDNHPAYISVKQYENNQEKIAMNANCFAPKATGAPQKGEGLLAGLIHCQRCDHQLGVSYPSSGAIVYSCRRGRRQRQGGPGGCFSFRANEVEELLSGQILSAVGSAGIEAAELACRQMAEERHKRRGLLEDAWEHARYRADLARRRLEAVDPANRLVFDTLAKEWEEALEVLEEAASKLQAFDRQEPPRPTAKQRQQLRELGRHLEGVWFHPDCDGRLKKQIVRTLIEHVYADVEEQTDEIVLWIKWAGGHLTELRHPRRRRKPRSKPRELKAILSTLRKVAEDEGIARILNRSRIRTERGDTWTKRRVTLFRNRHGIATFSATEKEREGWLLQEEAATCLEISPMSVHRLITANILPAEHHPGLPSVTKRSDFEKKAVKRAVAKIKSNARSPLPDDPNQLSLFTTTNL